MELIAEFDGLLREVQRAKDRQKNAETVTLSPRVLTKLEDHYWHRAEAMVRQRVMDADAGKERLVFDRDERLLLDAGFLDQRMILTGNPYPIMARLLSELYEEAGEDGPLYLSGWVSERYREILIQESLAAPPPPAERRTRLEAVVERLRNTRRKVLSEMTPLFTGLPGLDPEMTTLIVTGRLHEHLEDLGMELAREGSKEIKEKRDRFRGFYLRLLEALRMRVKEKREVLLLTGLRKLDAQIAEELARLRQEERRDETRFVAIHTDRPSLRQKRADFLEAELGHLRALLLLGTLESGRGSGCPVLLSDLPRLTHGHVARLSRLVNEYDRGVHLIPKVLLAAYGGLGFFEWDRNTLILPLFPAVDLEEAVVRAFANYRLLVDTLHHGGALRRGLGPALGEPFRDRFVEEYAAWVLRTGRGDEHAQSPEVVDAFARHLGPLPDGPVGESRILAMPPEELELELKELTARAVASESSVAGDTRVRERRAHETYRDLATVLWCQGKTAMALPLLRRALETTPQDTRGHYALALLLEKTGERKEAQEVLRELRGTRPDTLWALYAARRLERNP